MPNIVTTQIDVGSIVLQADDATSFEDATVTFAGADNFKAGTILARSTASGKYILYAVGGATDGNGTPRAILMTELTASGAGDLPGRVLLVGRVRKSKLIVDAAGDDSTITPAVKDLLRQTGIIAVESKQLAKADN